MGEGVVGNWPKSVLFLIAMVFLVFGGEMAAQGAALEYRLGPGDKVKVTVFGEEDLSGEYELGALGVVSMPLIGSVKGAGRTEKELGDAIAEKLLEGFLKNPRVAVEVLNYRPFYILGEVKEPGSYPYVNGMSIINAVAMGGGFTYRANEKKIFITRSNDPNQGKEKADFRTRVLPGDVIKVEERFF